MRGDQRFLLSIAISCISFAGCVNRQDTPSGRDQVDSQQPDSIASISQPVETAAHHKNQSSGEIKVFKNEHPLSGFGYDIYMNGKLYVHQPNVPAVQGNHGFKTTESAYKTAGLVLFKINNNILPPGVEIKELDSLGVLK